jgi:patatin-related protein
VREKELRIALVCFGGVSLAVYMHGISKEILKLVRASSALHALDRGARAQARFNDRVDTADAEYDTEAVYFELLREIGRGVDLRVIVDIVAGASAGGINGTMLARALAHDLPMGALRDLWLAGADVTELLAPEARAKRWSKWFIYPFIWGFAAARRLKEIEDKEVRRKLSLFVRSRWFKPPFDGVRMAQLMYDAVASMGEPARPDDSLLPAGQRLDLFVTLTDHYGYQQLLEVHDPPVIEEREHRHILRFSYRRWPNGEIETDFDLANAPALAFAARATSCFPGAFPPAQVAEMERVRTAGGRKWSGRAKFLERNFEPYLRARIDPAAACFLDGSVLNNKPFREAIRAIRDRPAYRQVDRRLVYVDPDPTRPEPPLTRLVPGFFTTLKSALSDIPRNEPIADELGWVNGFNERVRRLKAIVDAARPHITQLVSDIVSFAPDERLAVEQIRRWRESVNTQVAANAGFAYEGYVRLKLASVRALVAHLIATMLRLPATAPQRHTLTDVVDLWARRAGIAYEPATGHMLMQEKAMPTAALPRWARFLLAFDLDYRKRRLYFLIQGQNRLYQVLDDRAVGATAAAAAVDRLKRAFYQCLDALRHREAPEFFSGATRAKAQAIVDALPAEGARRQRSDIERFVAGQGAAIDAMIEGMAGEIGLDASTQEVDALLAGLDPAQWPTAARREVVVNYLGFPFWDVQTLSVTNWRDIVEFDEILVDRISPEDARTLARLETPTALKGTGLAHFAGFFSRAYRENDYLLGRLHGIDRLIDIVCDSAGLDGAADGIDVLALKRRAFEIVLAAEEKHLRESGGLIRRLREEFAALGL